MSCKYVFLFTKFLQLFLYVVILLVFGNRGNVIEITYKNFQGIENQDRVILYFYVQNCSRCDTFYEDMIEVMNSNIHNESFIFAKVNAVKHTDLLHMYKVFHVPQIVGIRRLNPFVYKDEYSQKGFLKFINQIFLSPVPILKTKIEFQTLYSFNNSVVIGYFNTEISIEVESFKIACLLLDNPNCFVTNNEDIKQILSTKEDHFIQIMKHTNNQREQTRFTGNFTSIKEIKEFIQIFSLPPLLEYDSLTKSKISSHPTKLHLLIFVQKSSSDFQDMSKEIKAISEALYKKALTILFDVDTSPDVKVSLKIFDLQVSDIPTFGFINVTKYQEYKYLPKDDSITFSNVIKMFNDIQNGTISAVFKSEMLSPNWNETDVLHLVGYNYKNVTENKNLTALVIFYSLQCPHTTNLKNTWEELGKYFSNKTDVAICIINSDLNEIEEVPVYHTPSIHLYRKTDKTNPLYFDKEINLQNLISFIENHENGALANKTETNVVENNIKEKEEL